MKRALLWAFVYVMTVVPAASGICGLGCNMDPLTATARTAAHNGTGAETAPECPLHARHASEGSGPAAPVAPASGRCGHDHTIARNGFVRSFADGSRPVSSVLGLAQTPATLVARTAESPLHQRIFAIPFIPSPQSLVLRI